eukprot:2035003-Rhodomonas_salina.2
MNRAMNSLWYKYKGTNPALWHKPGQTQYLVLTSGRCRGAPRRDLRGWLTCAGLVWLLQRRVSFYSARCHVAFYSAQCHVAPSSSPRTLLCHTTSPRGKLAALLQCCKIAAGMSDTRINLVQLINYGDGEYETLLKIAERAVADGMSAIMAQAPGSPPFRASLGLSFEQFYACENLFRHVLLRLCKASERDSRSTEEGLSQEARDFARINDFVNKIALELTLHVDSAVAGILLAGNTYNDEDVDWAGICTQVAHARMAGAEFTGGLESMGLEAMQLMM